MLSVQAHVFGTCPIHMSATLIWYIVMADIVMAYVVMAHAPYPCPHTYMVYSYGRNSSAYVVIVHAPYPCPQHLYGIISMREDRQLVLPMASRSLVQRACAHACAHACANVRSLAYAPVYTHVCTQLPLSQKDAVECFVHAKTSLAHAPYPYLYTCVGMPRTII